ncbi:MAG: tetratricopeptide repeat protein [Acidobacteriota bacterium]
MKDSRIFWRIPFLTSSERINLNQYAEAKHIAVTSREGVRGAVDVRTSAALRSGFIEGFLSRQPGPGASGQEMIIQAISAAVRDSFLECPVVDYLSSGSEQDFQKLLYPALFKILDAQGISIKSISLSNVDFSADRKRIEEISRLKKLIKKKKVLLIGIDGADFDIMNSLIGMGKLKNISILASSAAFGEIETIKPIISPIIWTSIATGMPPLRHGILDFLSLDPESGKKVPVHSSNRKAPALWTIFNALGLKSGVVGWWVTTPAERIDGYMVSDSLVSALFGSAGREASGTVIPQDEESAVKGMLRDFRSVTYDEVKRFIHITEEDYIKVMSGPGEGKFRVPVKGLASIIASTNSIHRINLYLYDKYRPDFNAVYYEGVDLVSHLFMAYAPPRRDHIQKDDFERYRDAVERFYEYMDLLIGDYIKRMDSETFMIIVSDHGFKKGDDRPYEISSVYTDTASFWHSDKAMMLISGGEEGTSGREAIGGTNKKHGALLGSVYDVAPTILSIFGLPEGSGMGVSLVRHERGEAVVDYDDLVQPLVEPASQEKVDEEFIASLKALGYISDGASSRKGMAPQPTHASRSESDAGDTRTAAYYNNQGIVLKNEGKIEDAIKSFHKALEIDPRSHTALYNLSSLHFSKKEYDKAEEYFFQAAAIMSAQEREMEIVRFAVVLEEKGQRERSKNVLKKGMEGMPDSYLLNVNLGTVLAREGRYQEASISFSRALSLKPESTIALNNLALCEYNLGNVQKAIEFWERSLRIDPQQQEIRRNLKGIKNDETID